MISIVVISKSDPGLATTLEALHRAITVTAEEAEVIVVDASGGQLDHIRLANPWVRWNDFVSQDSKRITIPEQRNVGVSLVRGEAVVFTDAGCTMADDWLDAIVAPLSAGEVCVAGAFESTSNEQSIYGSSLKTRRYVREAPTLNLAVALPTLKALGRFDESFEYGSDVDLCWRLVDAGHRILFEPAAVVSHDFSGQAKQLKRSFRYGSARARLYRKHAHRRSRASRDDPVLVFYTLFLVGLPLTAVIPVYPLLMVVPLIRARGRQPVKTLIDHLVYGAGALAFLWSTVHSNETRDKKD